MRKLLMFVVLLVIAGLTLAGCGGAATTPLPSATDTSIAAAPTNTTVAAAPTNTTMAAPTNTTSAVMTGTATITGTAVMTATAAPTKAPTPVPAKAGTLTFWVDAGRVQAIKDLGAKFTAKYNVPVNVQELGFGDIRDNLKIAGPANEGPDIIVGAHDWLGELVTNGVLEPINLGDKASSIDPVAIKAFTYNGQLYGLPYSVEAIALMYNKDLVPTPPTTLDEMISMAKQLQDSGKVQQGYVIQTGPSDPYHTYPYFSGFGSAVFGTKPDGTYDASDLRLDNAGGIAAMQKLRDMVNQGVIKPGVSADVMNSLFQTGKSAMMFTGPWALPDVRKAKVNYGIAKLPKMQDVARPFVGSQGFMINSFGPNKLLAQTFLTEFVATDEGMKTMYNAVPAIPAWLPVRSQGIDPDLQVFAQSVADGQPMPSIPQMSAVWTDWGKALDLNFQGQETPEKAIKDAAASIRAKIAGGQ